MSDTPQRPRIRVKFTQNVETGEMSMIVDDSSPTASEEYHDKVAKLFATPLARNADIQDAGPIRIAPAAAATEVVGATPEATPEKPREER
jgi:hypothetical protein